MKSNLLRTYITCSLGVLLTAILLSVALPSLPAQARQNDADRTGWYSFGAAMGLQTGTADSTAFALGLYGDYYINRRFSIGPLLQMGLTEDLFHVGLTGQAKYTFEVAGLPELKPHVQGGIGFIHADLDRRGSGAEKDTSFLMPIGIGVEYKITDSIWLDNTFLFNFSNLDVRDEKFFFSWLIGLKF
jgi:opacity protein-like surface antigen